MFKYNNTMKKIITKTALLLAVFLIGSNSCTKEFLEIENPNAITKENYFKTEQHAFESIVSCYDIMKSKGMFGRNFQWFIYSVDGLSNFENATWNNMQYKTNDPLISGIFNFLYRGMYRCNVALDVIPGIEIANKEKKDRLLAEAHFFRGFYLYYLSTLFGTPPLIMKELLPGDDQKNKENSEKGELLEVAIEELKKAAPDLPLKSEIAMTGRVSRGAANAMIGKCYIWKAQYDSAEHYLAKVIESGQYQLVQKQKDDSLAFVNAFLSNFTAMPINGYGGKNNSASILEVQNQHSPENDWLKYLPGHSCDGSLLSKYFTFISTAGSYSNFAPNYKAAELFEGPGPAGMAFDPRKYGTLIMVGDTVEKRPEMIDEHWDGEVPIFKGFPKSFGGDYGCRKYYYPIHYGQAKFNDPNNWRVIRYAHVLLLYAEAAYHNGNTTEALDKLNMIRNRAGMSPRTTITPETIIYETRVECMFEVNTILNIIRWSALDKNIWGQENFETPWITDMYKYLPGFISNKHELFPMPLYEVDFQEGALVQNPGY